MMEVIIKQNGSSVRFLFNKSAEAFEFAETALETGDEETQVSLKGGEE